MSDKNVEIIKELIQEYKTYNDLDGIQDLSIYVNALEHILAEREQKDERIQELEEESKILEFQNKQVENYAEELKKYNKTVSDRIVEYKKNSIPKQAVIDKMEELKLADGSNRKDNVENLARELAIEVLQELVEGER